MPPVFRYDAAVAPDVAHAVQLPNGWLKAPAFLARTGILEYETPQGEVFHELRVASEVFDPESLASFQLVPLVDGHPDPSFLPNGLDADNAKDFTVGHVGEVIRRDEDKVAATIMVTAKATVERILAGTSQLSAGYTCEPVEEKGLAPPGLRCVTCGGNQYDARQTKIRVNHIAVVWQARAGADIRVRLDSAGNAVIGVGAEASEAGERTASMALKIRLDGIDVEVSEQAAQLIEKLQKSHADASEKMRADAASSKASLDQASARADAADRKVAALEVELKAAKDPAAIEAAVECRSALVGKAREVLGAEFKLDGLDEQAVKRAVVAKLDPDAKLEGKSIDFVDATYEAALKYRRDASGVVRVDSAVLAAQLKQAMGGGTEKPRLSAAEQHALDVETYSGKLSQPKA